MLRSSKERYTTMVIGLWGKKIGMTQIFQNDKVVPVTVIDTANWVITQIKSDENDGYNAVQVGCLRAKHLKEKFTPDWLKKPSKFFGILKEIKVSNLEGLSVGNSIDLTVLEEGKKVDIYGHTKGCGFAGAMKRHGFKGGAGSHGDKTGRRTGSLSFMRAEGRVIKGKRLPGHMGVELKAMKNLEVVKIDSGANVILVKGSIPGKSGSLVFVKKCG